MLTYDIINILEDHGIEVWNNYAVESYYHRDGYEGESFKPLSELQTIQSIRDWLGY